MGLCSKAPCNVFVDTERWRAGDGWEEQGGVLSLWLSELFCHYRRASTRPSCFCCYQRCKVASGPTCTGPPHVGLLRTAMRIIQHVFLIPGAVTTQEQRDFRPSAGSCGVCALWFSWTAHLNDWPLWHTAVCFASRSTGLLAQGWELSAPTPEAVVPAGMSDTWQYLVSLTYWSESHTRVQLESVWCWVYLYSLMKLKQGLGGGVQSTSFGGHFPVFLQHTPE